MQKLHKTEHEQYRNITETLQKHAEKLIETFKNYTKTTGNIIRKTTGKTTRKNYRKNCKNNCTKKTWKN